MFSNYTHHYIVQIEEFSSIRNLYFDQTNGDCFLQVTTKHAGHYRSCPICKERLQLVSEKMTGVRNFELIEANFSDDTDDGIYVRFNAGGSVSPFIFLKNILQRNVVRIKTLGSAKPPFSYGTPAV